MKKINVAVVGAGRIGRFHAENLLQRVSGVTLRAVCDPFLDESWSAGLSIDMATKNVDDVANANGIDAVVIATPSDTHISLIQKFVDAKKHIMCEKPVGFDAQAIRKVTENAEKAGIVFQVGFNRRFDVHFARVKDGIKNGSIGAPQLVRIVDRDPKAPSLEYAATSGGLFFDFAIHDFDMARFVTGSEVEEVFATGSVMIEPGLKKFGDVDTAVTVLKMRSGAICAIDNSRQAVYGYDQRLEVFGSKGSIEAQNVSATNVILRNDVAVYLEKPHTFFMQRYHEAYVAELNAFFDCIRSTTKPIVGGHDAAQAVCIAQAAKQSCDLNRPVKVGY